MKLRHIGLQYVQSLSKGCIKFPKTWYFSPSPFIKSSFSSFKFASPSPLFPLIFFPAASNYAEGVIFFPTAMIFPSPLQNLIYFLKYLRRMPQGGGGGIRNLYFYSDLVIFTSAMPGFDCLDAVVVRPIGPLDWRRVLTFRTRLKFQEMIHQHQTMLN